MNDIVISARNLGKQYSIGAAQERRSNLRDQIAETISASIRGLRSGFLGSRSRVAKEASTIWALDNISFDIREGEVVGVIGRNGAGKSTLLKVLSRITEPTKGHADIRGRVGCLLEVGTGFHPELTGRENVFLNGAILGMRRQEIVSKFDEIVAFAEIDRFLDTPVKRYSTGMYMRLGFAVAASLDPEILIVDEVLAVGDAAFQKKCLGKMAGVAKEGRTVIFVSHNMPAVQSLCNRCLLLEAGRLRVAGSLHEGVTMYHRSLEETSQDGNSGAHEVSIGALTANGSIGLPVGASQPIHFEFDLTASVSFTGFRMFLILENPQGVQVIHSVINERTCREIDGHGTYHVTVDMPALWLTPGLYSAHVKMICNGIGLKGRYFSDKLLVMVESDYDPDAAPGLLTPPVTWQVSSSSGIGARTSVNAKLVEEFTPLMSPINE
jgi:lipopolysaccharide transport system ATP-binding protein